MIGALALTVVGASLSPKQEDVVLHTTAGCIGGYCFGTLPDWVEPATNPNHRQFFHSLVFAGLVGYGLYRLYQWDPDSPEEKMLRFIVLAAVGAYLVHLALDATTPRSLPMVGRIR